MRTQTPSNPERFAMSGKQLDLFDPKHSKPPMLRMLSPDEIFERADEIMLPNLKENNRIERKPVGIHSKELGEYISMWANTKPAGGIVAIGVANNGELLGCAKEDEKHINELKRGGAIHCPDALTEVREVPFFHENGDPDYVMLLRVPFNGRRLIRNTSGKAYWRQGESKFEIPIELAQDIESDLGVRPFEQEPCQLSYPDDFDIPLIADWASKVKPNRRWDLATSNEQVLHNSGLGRVDSNTLKFTPNMACALLFAKTPDRVLPGCRIHLLRFAGSIEGTGQDYAPMKDEFAVGTIPEVIRKTEAWLESQLRLFTRFGKDGKFHTTQEYPKEAWYEGIVNACVHRSYSLRNSHASVKMFNDRLVFESPGGFMPNVNEKNIYDVPPTPRNPHLYYALWYFGHVRCNNEGTKRIRDFMASERLPSPQFSETEKGHFLVRLVLKNDIEHRKLWSDEDSIRILGQKAFEGLSDEERAVVNYVIEFGQINVSDTQRLTKFSWPRCKQLLSGLEEKRILKYVRKEPGKHDPKARYVLFSAE